MRAVAQAEVDRITKARQWDAKEYSTAAASGIYGNRFVSDHIPAWHELGTVHGADIETADEAFRIMGPYTVVARPLFTEEGVPVPVRGLFRIGDGEEADLFFGPVSNDYSLIEPDKFVKIWDAAGVGQVATMMALKEGRVLAIASYLPDIDVRGDLVSSYLIGANGMDGGHSLDMMISCARPVCRNTLSIAKRFASELFKIRHDERAEERAASWLKEAHERAIHKVQVLQQAFDIFAGFNPTAKQVESVLAAAWPVKSPPRDNAPKAEVERRAAEWAVAKARQERKQAEALEIFEDDSTEQYSIPGLERTGWKLYNSVGFKTSHDEARSDEDTAYNLILGTRADICAAAFDRTYEEATGISPRKGLVLSRN